MAGQTFGLEHYQFTSFGKIFRNLTVKELVEHEFTNEEGKFGPKGAMMVSSGPLGKTARLQVLRR